MGNTGRDFREFAQEPISLCVFYHLFFVAWLILGNQVSHWNRYIINAGAALEISWTPIRERSVLLYRLLVVIGGGRIFIIYFITHSTRINLGIHLSWFLTVQTKLTDKYFFFLSAKGNIYSLKFLFLRRRTFEVCGFGDFFRSLFRFLD